MKFYKGKFLQGIMIGSLVVVPFCVNTPKVPVACGDQTASNSADCATPTATPTPTPCYNQWNKYKRYDNWNCNYPSPTTNPTPSVGVSVTPTPIVEASPSATPTPDNNQPLSNSSSSGGNGGSSSAPGAPVCNIAFQAPVLQGFQEDQVGSVTFSWWGVPNIDKYSIRYGYDKDQLVYGEDNIPSSSTSITLNDLQPGNHVWAIITAWRGGCAEDSNELDPILPFKLSHEIHN